MKRKEQTTTTYGTLAKDYDTNSMGFNEYGNFCDDMVS
jgi:hypothetical protein